MKATETAVDIVSKNSHGNVCSEVLSKLVAYNMGFVNCSGLKFSPDFQNTIHFCSVKKSVLKYFPNVTK